MYHEDKITPLLENPSDYHLIVARASVDSACIPLFIFKDNGLLHSDPSYVSQYRLCLSYQANNAPVYIKFKSESLDVNASNRHVYSINHFIKLLNTALSEAFTDLTNLGALPSLLTPYFIYDIDTSLFSLVVEKTYENAIHLYMNSRLFSIFSNFEHVKCNIGDANAKEYEIVIRNRYNNNTTTNLPSPLVNQPAFIMTGEYINDTIKDMNKLILTTSGIPVSEENMPKLNSDGSVSSINTTMAIITDFVTNEDEKSSLGRHVYVYNPSIYRKIDLTGSRPLHTIDIQMYWQSRDGSIHRVMIPPYSKMSVKLLFSTKNKNID
jgi:hypothetical protein